jgi:hypothetical protein
MFIDLFYRQRKINLNQLFDYYHMPLALLFNVDAHQNRREVVYNILNDLLPLTCFDIDKKKLKKAAPVFFPYA